MRQAQVYLVMHQRLTNDHGHVVTRNVVRQILKVVDPEGVEARSCHRLRRRQYCAKGLNYIWHIDGYDKLKPFGFCIHGAHPFFSFVVVLFWVCCYFSFGHYELNCLLRMRLVCMSSPCKHFVLTGMCSEWCVVPSEVSFVVFDDNVIQ